MCKYEWFLPLLGGGKITQPNDERITHHMGDIIMEHSVVHLYLAIVLMHHIYIMYNVLCEYKDMY